jgi:RNA-directed DNA polymerase
MNVTKAGVKGSQLPMEGSTQKDSAEHEKYAGVHNPVRIAETDNTNANEFTVCPILFPFHQTFSL